MEKKDESITIVMLNISAYQGSMTLSKTERAGLGVKAPRKVVNNLTKQIINPKEISMFESIRKRSQRACLKVGVRMFGGYAIPTSEIKILSAELNQLKNEFDAATTDFIGHYQTLAASWQHDNPEWASLLFHRAHSLEKVKQAFGFQWSAMSIEPLEVEGSTTADQLASIGGKAFEEIGADARLLWKNSLAGRTKISQKTIRPIRGMIEKLNGLSFVDARLMPFIAHARGVIESLPQTGTMEKSDLSAVAGLIMMMSRGDGIILNMKVPESVMTDEDEAEDFVKMTQSALPPSASIPPTATVAGWF